MINKGKVIKIISPTRIVINLGKKHGIHQDDLVQVYIPGKPLTDGDIFLGHLDFIKETLTVIQAEELFSICASIETIEEEIESNPFLSRIPTPYHSQPKKVQKRQINKLSVNKQQIEGYGMEVTREISVGDCVRKVVD